MRQKAMEEPKQRAQRDQYKRRKLKQDAYKIRTQRNTYNPAGRSSPSSSHYPQSIRSISSNSQATRLPFPKQHSPSHLPRARNTTPAGPDTYPALIDNSGPRHPCRPRGQSPAPPARQSPRRGRPSCAGCLVGRALAVGDGARPADRTGSPLS